MFAAREGRTKCIEILLQAGADATAVSKVSSFKVYSFVSMFT